MYTICFNFRRWSNSAHWKTRVMHGCFTWTQSSNVTRTLDSFPVYSKENSWTNERDRLLLFVLMRIKIFSSPVCFSLFLFLRFFLSNAVRVHFSLCLWLLLLLFPNVITVRLSHVWGAFSTQQLFLSPPSPCPYTTCRDAWVSSLLYMLTWDQETMEASKAATVLSIVDQKYVHMMFSF